MSSNSCVFVISSEHMCSDGMIRDDPRPYATDQVTQGGRGRAPDQTAAGQQREAECGDREAEQEDGQGVGQVLECVHTIQEAKK